MTDKDSQDAIEKGLALYHAQEALKAQKRLATAAEVNAGMRKPGSAGGLGLARLFGLIFIGAIIWIFVDAPSFVAFTEGIFEIFEGN